MKSKHIKNKAQPEGKVGCLGTLALVSAVLILAAVFMHISELPF